MKNLRALLIVVGFVSVGGVSLAVLSPSKGVTWAQLADAGLGDVCAIKLASCPVLMSVEALEFARDAGIVGATHATKYAQVRTPLAVCDPPNRSRFFVLPNRPATKGVEFDFFDLTQCKVSPCKNGECASVDKVAPFKPEPLPCVYRPLDAGAGCSWSDGGSVIPKFLVVPSWAASGASCVQSACVQNGDERVTQ